MVTEHKAFIFDYNKFSEELAGILSNALFTQSSHELINFIENNLSALKDPYEGEPLDYSWKEMIETEDISQYGDLAITKYYNPQCDLGIGYDWEQLSDALVNELCLDISPLLGLTFGPESNYFDPGKLGSYFQSPELVIKNFNLINSLPNEKQNTFFSLVGLKKMLADALALGKGLYITF